MNGSIQKGEYVVYGKVGVCRVVDRQQMSFGAGGGGEYYVLAPESDPHSSVYVPCGNRTLMERLRPLMTQQEIEDMLEAVPQQTVEWIDDRTRRQDCFRSMMADGDRRQLLRLIRCLSGKKRERMAEGKTLSSADESLMRECIRLVDEEFSLALRMPREQVGAYIRAHLPGTAEPAPAV